MANNDVKLEHAPEIRVRVNYHYNHASKLQGFSLVAMPEITGKNLRELGQKLNILLDIVAAGSYITGDEVDREYESRARRQ